MKQQMIPNQMISSSFPPSNITTDQIQKFLDENKQLILAIMNNQNLGKLAECAQYQALLQKNLMYLAAIADAQPPTPNAGPTMPSQMTAVPHPGMQQQGGFYMQQQSGFPQQMQAMQFASPPMQAQMGLRPSGLPTGPTPGENNMWRATIQDGVGGVAATDAGGKDGGASGGAPEEPK